MRHKHADLIIAWANGAKIQYQDTSDSWHDVLLNSPSWNEDTVYRIKPEPKPEIVNTSYVQYINGCAMLFPELYNPNVRFTFDGETKKLKQVELI